MLELTHTVERRRMQAQLLDSMELERERGITIKLQPVRMQWRDATLNLIDTPGHVDFQYEVSRSLQAVEGAVLLVDATQGIQAQTIANLYLALAQNLVIIPVINKIDLPAARPEAVRAELVSLLGVKTGDILAVSAKTGEGVPELLDAIAERVPAAKGPAYAPAKGGASAGKPASALRALIFDSYYDDYKGVVAYVRVVNGSMRRGDALTFMGTKAEDKAIEVGVFTPEFLPTDTLSAGQIGYVATGLKDVKEARVGDTITHSGQAESEALPGFAIVQPKVFAGLFPASGDQYHQLRDSLSKLQLSDASLTVQPEQNEALGQGFRCGFLGILHLDIVQERLRREWEIPLVVTVPSVRYRVRLRDGAEKEVHTPAEWPEGSQIELVLEQLVTAEVLTPTAHMGAVFEVLKQHEGELRAQEVLGDERMLLKFSLPLRELVVDLNDQLKSATAGYASLSYEVGEWCEADVVKLTVLINHVPHEALSHIVPRQAAESAGRRLVGKLRAVLPRQLFAVPLQAAVGGTIVARETLPAMRKDVTAHLYGGDVTRKRKLLEKQKKGKKRLAQQAVIDIPPTVFLDLFRR